jgi:hypothetical protein
MKNLIIILLVILLSGCHLTKKTTKSEALTTNSVQTTETASANENLRVTNNLVTGQKTKKVTVEYYPPTEKPAAPPAAPADPPPVAPTTEQTEHGAIKSITTETTEEETHDQGITEAAKEQQAAKTTVDNSASSVKTDDVEKPAADPYRWRYIFGILVILTGVVVYWKRATVLPWIKTIFTKNKAP